MKRSSTVWAVVVGVEIIETTARANVTQAANIQLFSAQGATEQLRALFEAEDGQAAKGEPPVVAVDYGVADGIAAGAEADGVAIEELLELGGDSGLELAPGLAVVHEMVQALHEGRAGAGERNFTGISSLAS